MNCKRGDIARVLRDDFGHDDAWPGVPFKLHISGFYVRCKRLVDLHGIPAWELEESVTARFTGPFGMFGTADIQCIADELLRPLPGLGDLQGEDETLAWPRPTPVETPVTA